MAVPDPNQEGFHVEDLSLPKTLAPERLEDRRSFLQVVDRELLVWTGALDTGFRPQDKALFAAVPFVMSALIAFEDAGSGTKYTAIARHGDVAARQAHEQMGFHDGWGKALDQLVEHAKAGHFGA